MSGHDIKDVKNADSDNQLNGFSNEAETKDMVNGKNKIPPEIPHVTNNIVPLSNVLKFYSQEAYKQLTTVIENLSTSYETETDANRKKRFLEVIISLRQDFVKIYTLVKWASKSKSVSKLIDILNWLRSQEFYFENLGYGLNELNGYSGAQMPNSDIITSLEVLVKGRPQLPSYGFIKPPVISAKKTLEVLKELNLILITRLALMDDLPERFRNNYVVKDGRVYLTVPNEYQVSLTVANDNFVSEQKDYAESPFYLIDFMFLFGINPETSLITYKSNKIITKLPEASHQNLEKIANRVLLNSGLRGLYDLLHKYSISFKLYLIARQLRDLSINTKWRGNIQFKYQNGKSLIIINYWCLHYLSKNWKTFIELGIDRSYNLNFRWFRNGCYDLNHGISGLFEKSQPQSSITDENSSTETTKQESKEEETEDLSIDFILNIIANKHAQILMSKIYEKINSLITTDSDACSLITPHQLHIKLTPMRSACFCINPLSGFFYFTDPTPLQNQFIRRINSPSNNSISMTDEGNMVSQIATYLLKLKLELLKNDISNKLTTVEWIPNEIVKLADSEVKKLTINEDYNPNFSSLQFFRQKNWPFNWFLINFTSSLSSKCKWWVSRIRSIQGDWKIQWVKDLTFNYEQDGYDFKFYRELSTLCSNLIIDNMVAEELNRHNIRFIRHDHPESLINKLELDESSVVKFEADLKDTSVSHKSTTVLFNEENLLPVWYSSTCVFLEVGLLRQKEVTEVSLRLYGRLRGLPLSSIKENLNQLNLYIDEMSETFQIANTLNLLSAINETSSISDTTLLNEIFDNLFILNELIKILDQLHKNSIELIKDPSNDIVIKIDESLNNTCISLPRTSNGCIQLSQKEDGAEWSDELNLIISYFNRYIREQGNSKSIIGMLRYIKDSVSILKAIKSTKLKMQELKPLKLSNGLTKINFEVKVPYINAFQLIFYLNSFDQNSTKKIIRDKIVFSLSFKRNKFSNFKKNYVQFSLKDNTSLKSLRFKPLFESMFSAIAKVDFEFKEKEGEDRLPLVKLNYVYLVDPGMIEEVMRKVIDSFSRFVKEN